MPPNASEGQVLGRFGCGTGIFFFSLGVTGPIDPLTAGDDKWPREITAADEAD